MKKQLHCRERVDVVYLIDERVAVRSLPQRGRWPRVGRSDEEIILQDKNGGSKHPTRIKLQLDVNC